MSKKIRKMLALSILVVLVLGTGFIGLYIQALGYDNLKRIHILSTTTQEIIAMDEPGQFLTKSRESGKLLKERMQREGWTFTEQMGAAYLFTKDGIQTSVSAKIWRNIRIFYKGIYVIYKMADPNVNIAD